MHTEQEALQKIADVLKIDPAHLTPATRAGEIERWDSMGSLDIIMMLEHDFDVVVEINESERLESVEGILKFLREAGKLA